MRGRRYTGSLGIKDDLVNAGASFEDAAVVVDCHHVSSRKPDDLTAFLRAVPGVQEVSIGHALIADALELGYTATVKDYLRCIDEAFAVTT